MSAWNPAMLSVIVIDDQQVARIMLKKMLQAMQIHQIFEASDGREALRLLDSAPEMIDLVICDWNMPAMTGIDLLRQVRAAGFDVPFLMVTGRADEESAAEAKEAGVSGYIPKPISQTQLEAKMRVVVTKQRVAT